MDIASFILRKNLSGFSENCVIRHEGYKWWNRPRRLGQALLPLLSKLFCWQYHVLSGNWAQEVVNRTMSSLVKLRIGRHAQVRSLAFAKKRLSKHEMTICSKNLEGGHGPFGPPGYAYAPNLKTWLRACFCPPWAKFAVSCSTLQYCNYRRRLLCNQLFGGYVEKEKKLPLVGQWQHRAKRHKRANSRGKSLSKYPTWGILASRICITTSHVVSEDP